MDPGEVKPLVKRVNPAGVSTPARPGTVAAVGNTLQGTVLLGVCGYSELEDSRIQWWWRQQLRWSGSTAATKSAAVGARATTEMAL